MNSKYDYFTFHYFIIIIINKKVMKVVKIKLMSITLLLSVCLGCTDLWGDKVLRSGCGAHFRMKIVPEVSWSSLVNIKGQVILADNNYAGTDNYTNIANHEEVNVFRKAPCTELPIVPYNEADYCKTTPLILVIGGETHGLSEDAYEFARKSQGVRINIPLQNGIESLNTATAVGILCFEARKQMLNVIKNNNKIDNVELAN